MASVSLVAASTPDNPDFRNTLFEREARSVGRVILVVSFCGPSLGILAVCVHSNSPLPCLASTFSPVPAIPRFIALRPLRVHVFALPAARSCSRLHPLRTGSPAWLRGCRLSLRLHAPCGATVGEQRTNRNAIAKKQNKTKTDAFNAGSTISISGGRSVVAARAVVS